MDEFTVTPVSNVLFSDRTLSLPPEEFEADTFDIHQTDNDISTKYTPIKVRGIPIKNVQPIQTDTFGPFKVELFQGFRGEISTKIAGKITWNKPIVINREITYRIHLFIDVSGSMDTCLCNSRESKINIIIQAMNLFKETLNTLIKKGMQIELSLHRFSDTCEEVFSSTKLTPEYLAQWDVKDTLQSKSLTNIWECVSKAHSMQMDKGLNGSHDTYIIMSDGMHTVGPRLSDEIEIDVFDYAIGIGTTSDYDADMLNSISKNNVIACPTADALSAEILRLGCEDYMTLARDVNIRVNGSEIEIGNWVSGSNYVFTTNISHESPIIDIRYVYDVSVGRKVIHMDSLPIRTTKKMRRVVELCEFNAISQNTLKHGDITDAVVRSMMLKAEFFTHVFEEGDNWCYIIAKGLYLTWKNLYDIRYLPQLDRQLSVQSCIRQQTCNNYNFQTPQSIKVYSQNVV